MLGTKKWYKSKTIWGSIVAVAATGASMFGITIGGPTQAALVEVALQGVALAGALLTAYGRFDAKKAIE